MNVVPYMKSHVWVCKGCLIKAGAGADPDRVTESCIARFGDRTCHFCDHIQDHTWFKHMFIRDLPPSLQPSDAIRGVTAHTIIIDDVAAFKDK